jgi:hypothetical protein
MGTVPTIGKAIMFKRILAGAAIASAIVCSLGEPADAGRTLWYGEFQTGFDADAGDVLNIDMFDGKLRGVGPVQRCEDMGGAPHWHWTWHYTCLAVDF